MNVKLNICLNRSHLAAKIMIAAIWQPKCAFNETFSSSLCLSSLLINSMHSL